MPSTKCLRAGGVVIAVVAMFFVVRSVYGYADQLSEMLQAPQFIAVVVASGIFYGLALQLVGLAWFTLLTSVGEKAVAPVLALRIFARTQVYKYLPTNVIHLVGRFVVASRYGASKDVLSYAQVMEIVLMILAAGSVALLFSFSFVLQVGEDYGISRYLASTVYLVGGLAAFGARSHCGWATFQAEPEACHLFYGCPQCRLLCSFFHCQWLNRHPPCPRSVRTCV